MSEHLHTVKFDIDEHGVTATFSCAAPVNADCRRTCVIGCDASLEGYRCQHDIVDKGNCLLVQWIDDSGETIESYHGEPHPAVSGPVHLKWVPASEAVEWRYPS